MTPSILQATPDHLALLVPLFDAYRMFYGQASDPEGARGFLRDRLTTRDSVIFLATDGDQADHDQRTGLGFAQLYPSFSSVALARIWILNDLFVSLDARRAGLGRQLLDAVRTFAIATGAARVDLATAVDNHVAKALYESVGYRLDERFDHYKLWLGE